MCLYPKLIKNPKYRPNKKNGGRPPFAYDTRVMWVPVGCGECMECMKKKARDWQIRLQEEIRTNKNGKFITLTFDDKSLEELKKVLLSDGETMPEKWENEVARIAMRRFLERWRKKIQKISKTLDVYRIRTQWNGENTYARDNMDRRNKRNNRGNMEIWDDMARLICK